MEFCMFNADKALGGGYRYGVVVCLSREEGKSSMAPQLGIRNFLTLRKKTHTNLFFLPFHINCTYERPGIWEEIIGEELVMIIRDATDIKIIRDIGESGLTIFFIL